MTCFASSATTGDPDDGDRLETGGIGEQLAEVGVVGLLELVLDQDHGLGIGVLADEVGAERADRLLLMQRLEVEAEGAD